MNTKKITFLITISFLATAQAGIKDTLINKYDNLKRHLTKENAIKASKIAYTGLSAAYFYDENKAQINNILFETGDLSKISGEIICFTPNIIANYLLHKKENKKAILNKPMLIENNNLSKKEKAIKTLKTIFKTKEGRNSVFYSGISGLSTTYLVLLNIVANKSKDPKTKGLYNNLKKILFLDAPTAYLSYVSGKKAVDSFKEGYNKVK